MAPDKDNELVLVDGSSFLFRAYHAIGSQGGLSTRDGQPTHAVFGVVNMLRSLIREVQPEYLAMVMDAKGKTFRHEMYPQYKANRPPMPDDLRVQLGYLLEIIPAMGLPLVSVPGIEADDVIGTLATRAVRQGYRVMIISSDKDLAQLVNERVVMVDTMKNSTLDPDGVMAKFGVPPERIIDLLALTGDTSDNVPGIPRVGPKTAAKWLAEYGSLDELVARADEVKGKIGEALRENLDILSLSRTLVTLKLDAELDLTFHDLTLREPDRPNLRCLYKALEFRSWLAELGDEGDMAETVSPPDPATATEYETILDDRALDRWIKRMRTAEVVALDTETTSVDAHQASLVGMSFCVKAGKAAYLPLAHDFAGAPPQLDRNAALDRLRPLLEDAAVVKTGQNLKYDLEVLGHHGVSVAGAEHDTMLMSYLLDAGNSRHDMDTLATRHLGHTTIKFSDVAGSGKNQLTFNEVPLDRATEYAAEDADVTLRLHQALLPRLEGIPRLMDLYRDMEIPLIRVLERMETRGVRVDADMLLAQSAEIAERLVDIEREAHRAAGEEFNIASPKQIQEILFEKQGLPVTARSSKGQTSTEEKVLQYLAMEHELT
ncbi:MAG: DNA polymerase, partial [Gammaproteobacteria bacterium]|nr:DNA polymerase [Gammaproteobacteria bacterium]